MPKKYTYEYVKQYFKDNDCELLENIFLNFKQKLKYKCNCGNISEISFDSFKRGSRCNECAKIKRGNKKRLDNNYVKQVFEENGCELLSKYVTSDSKLTYKCTCGNIANISFHKFKAGNRCNYCKGGRISKSKTHEYSYIKKKLEDKGYILLSKEYIKSSEKLDLICRNGHKIKMAYSSIINGNNLCLVCSGNVKHSYEYINNFFKQRGFKLTSTEYINAHSKLKCICPFGHNSSISYSDFKKYNGCKKCVNKKLSEERMGEKNPNWNPDREHIKTRKLFRRRCEGMLSTTLKYLNLSKTSSTYKLLGYNGLQLKEHILNHKNYNKLIDVDVYHLDHVFPIYAFVKNGLTDEEYIPIINGLDNLQPLDPFTNLSKSGKYNRKKFDIFLKEHGIYLDEIK